MSNYMAITGKLGSGKGLCSVGMMRDYLARGKPVVTNMDIFPEHFKDKFNKTIRIYRIPDQPTESDILMCGLGNDTPDVEENGVAILDEAATWFNSHNWADKKAQSFNDFLVHLRKYGWDLILQIQSIESLNKQARNNIITSICHCAKIKQIYIPFVSPIIRFVTGKTPKLPKSMHYHLVEQFSVQTGIKEARYRYQGHELHNYYDTRQIFSADYPHGTFCYLTPWHLVGRYEQQPISFWRRLCSVPVFLLLAATVAVASAIDPKSRKYFQRLGVLA